MSNNHITSDSTIVQLISEVREQFLRERYAINPTNYDQIDIEKVKINDYTVKRFLVYQDLNKVSALNQLDEAMKWRKSFGVNDLNYSDFGVEMYKTGAWFICNDDKQARPVVYLRLKTYIKMTQFDKIVKKAVVLLLNKLDELGDEKGYVIFADLTDAGLKHIDLKLCRFMIKTMKNYFPGGLRCALLYNLPSFFNKIISMCKHLLGPKYSNVINVISNREQIFDFIDREKVPKYLGGKCNIDFTIPPPNCTLNSVELAEKNSIDLKDARKFVKLCEPNIIEAKLLVLGEI